MERLLINFFVGIIISGLFSQTAYAFHTRPKVDAEQKPYSAAKFFQRFHRQPEKPVFYVKSDNIELYIIDGFKYKKPADFAKTSAVQALIKEINCAKSSVDFAVFGFSSQPELLNALLKAQKRGVKVRWVFDVTPDYKNYYSGTFYTAKSLKNYANDYKYEIITAEFMKRNEFDYTGTLMHNKYFIIDNAVVWTGSTNISPTGTGGYNTNISAVIKSKELAEIYLKDFEKMYLKKEFHNDKIPLSASNLKLNDGSVVSVFFSPNEDVSTDGILPIINNSKNYVYVPIFYLTSTPIVDALVNAKKHGVDVKIIADANYASTKFSRTDELRKKGVPVKVENWGGKMHMKSLISDDKYIILGSCNFTSTGVKRNDENMIILENSILAKAFKEKFIYYWNEIPDEWLYDNPKPEGKDSIGSCTDGIDNDHDGLVDYEDPDCQI